MKACDAVKKLRSLRWTPVVVGAVCLAPFAGLLTRHDAIVSQRERDYAVMHVPLAEFEREELLAGRLPLWNPYLACGQPLLAAQQGMLFYPLSTPLCVAFGGNRGLEIGLFLHLAACYVGAYLLARRVNLSQHAAAYAAMVTTWSGALMGHLAEGHAGAVFETALVPWFFLALADLLASPRAMAAVRLAVVGALCSLAAGVQVFYYTLLAGVLWAAGSLVGAETAGHRVRAVCWGVAAAALAMLIAAVQLVPGLELALDGFAQSQRGTDRFAATYALDGADAARLLMPYLNGSPFAGVPQFYGDDHYHERVIYLGLAVPVLAAYGLSRAGVSKWQWAAAWGILAALAIAFGHSTPAFGALGHVVPGLLLFRGPGRIFCVASLPAALLAARGLDALANGERRAGPAGLIAMALAIIAAVDIPAYAALELAPSFDWRRYLHYARENLLQDLSLWAVLLVDAAAVIGLAALGRLRGRFVSLPLIAIAALDLGYFNVGNFRMEDCEPSIAAVLPPADPMSRFVEGAGFGSRSRYPLRYSKWTRALIAAHRPAVGTYDGGVLPAATTRLYEAVDARPGPALALAACRFAWRGGVVAENPEGALPRIRFVLDGCANAELPIETMTESDVRKLKEHLAPVRLVEEAPGSLEMEVSVPADGWLVVADTYYPGWVCRVDGRPQPIECAHGVFRRVRLEAGRHRVVMRYEPLSFRIGLAASVAGVVVAAAIALIHQLLRRRSNPITTTLP